MVMDEVKAGITALEELLPPDLVRALQRIDAIEQELRAARAAGRSWTSLGPLRHELSTLRNVVRHLSQFMTPQQRAAAARAGQLLGRAGLAARTALERLAAAAARRGVVQFTVQAMRAFGRGLARVAARAGLRLLAVIPPGAVIAGLALLLVLAAAFWFNRADASDARPRRPIASCDCDNVDAGLLTREYRVECRRREVPVLEAYRKGTLNVQVGDGRVVAAKPACDDTVSGPAAWPIVGGPALPPPVTPPGSECEHVSGLTRECR
jgi:hypothetical protein